MRCRGSQATLRRILLTDSHRRRVLQHVRSIGLTDCWVGAGFVRNAVWDHLHQRPPGRICGDVDVVWFDPARAEPEIDRLQEARLRDLDPVINWSVKNQSRMHARNGDPAYASVVDALRYWPEIATAVAVRLTATDAFQIAAPFGLADLFGLVLRPTPAFTGSKHLEFIARIREKAWLTRWPLLRVQDSVV